jgi:hypothetical protein
MLAFGVAPFLGGKGKRRGELFGDDGKFDLGRARKLIRPDHSTSLNSPRRSNNREYA